MASQPLIKDLPGPAFTPSSLIRGFRREGLSLLLIVLLFIVIIGPMLAVIFWAFAEQWRYPSLVPTKWGLSYWAETLTRNDVVTALPLSIGLASVVTLLSAVICLPASYAFARMNFPGR